jgi:hypothetical protein
MKGHKAHHHMGHLKAYKKGGSVESDKRGDEDALHDLEDEPEDRVNAEEIAKEASERKSGGRAKRKTGGHIKHVGDVKGEMAKEHGGRKPRKSGGKATSDVNPFTSAKHGTTPKGRTEEVECP